MRSHRLPAARAARTAAAPPATPDRSASRTTPMRGSVSVTARGHRTMHRPSSPYTVVAVLLMLVLAACSTGDTSNPSAEGTEAASSAVPSTASSEDAEPSGAAPSGEPIVVGSTLSLTGPLSATGVIHQIAGEQFVEQLNEQGGLLGRPVEWTVLDDESDQASVATLYERLISEEQVDLIIGPYATPLIISAMAVAERHGYVMPQHTAVLAPLMTYECQFPAWSIGPEPQVFVPEQVYDALESLDEPPSTIAFV